MNTHFYLVIFLFFSFLPSKSIRAELKLLDCKSNELKIVDISTDAAMKRLFTYIMVKNISNHPCKLSVPYKIGLKKWNGKYLSLDKYIDLNERADEFNDKINKTYDLLPKSEATLVLSWYPCECGIYDTPKGKTDKLLLYFSGDKIELEGKNNDNGAQFPKELCSDKCEY